jgi:phospholipase D1/2
MSNTGETGGVTHGGRRAAWAKLIAFVLVVAALAAVWRYTPLSQLVTAARITAWARAFRGFRWAPVIVMLAYTPAAFIMFPRPLITLFTVVAFGPWLGFVYGMIGIMLAALAAYYVGRALPDGTVHRLAGDKLDALSKRLRQHGVIAVLLLRITPTAPFAVESMVAGALRVKALDYSIGSFLGLAPGVLGNSVFGSQLATALEDVGRVNYWILAAVIIVLAGITIAAGRWVAKA